jgi:hypothetical protein
MAVSYGGARRRVMSSDLNRVGIIGSTVLFNGEKDGGLELTFRADNFGCGSTPSSFAVEFKSEIAWRQIDIEFNFLGNVGCWSIGSNPALDVGTSVPTGFTSLNNLLAFSSVNKDKVYDPVYTYELPQISITNESQYTYNCGDPAANWGILNTTEYRKFKMIRTKNIKNDPAGILVVKSCTETGANSLTTLKNIFFII